MRNRSSTNRKLAVKEVEKVLGKKLPLFSVVHHVDGDEANNSHTNLVICEDQRYHCLLHQRTDALKACGCASWRRCKFCGKYDAPNNLRICSYSYRDTVTHAECERRSSREWYRRSKILRNVNN